MSLRVPSVFLPGPGVPPECALCAFRDLVSPPGVLLSVPSARAPTGLAAATRLCHSRCRVPFCAFACPGAHPSAPGDPPGVPVGSWMKLPHCGTAQTPQMIPVMTPMIPSPSCGHRSLALPPHGHGRIWVVQGFLPARHSPGLLSAPGRDGWFVIRGTKVLLSSGKGLAGAVGWGCFGVGDTVSAPATPSPVPAAPGIVLPGNFGVKELHFGTGSG